jgi:hypothetical protein
MSDDKGWGELATLVSGDPGIETGIGTLPSQAAIAAGEAEIGAFPPSYRRFVETYGWLAAPALTVYGLGPEIGDHMNVVIETLAERNVFQPRLPPDLIAVAPDGGGNYWCLRVASLPSDAPTPVYFHDHETAEVSEDAPDFVRWLLEALTQ